MSDRLATTTPGAGPAAAPSASEPRSGWFRREVRALLTLGLPMVGTQLFIMAMGFVDTVVPGRYGTNDLAGVAIGGSLLWPVLMLFNGLTMAVTPIVSQNRGAGRTGESGHSIRQALWVAALSSVIPMIVLSNAAPVFALIGADPAVVAIADGYLDAVVWGIPALSLYVVLRYSCEGLGHTVPPMLIAGSALVLNAVLNVLLVFGYAGFPELGGVGTGWATTCVFWLELALVLLVLRTDWFRATGFSARFEGPKWSEIRRLLFIGVPVGLTIFVEMAVYSVIGLLAARMGTAEVAAHSVVGNLNWMTFVIPMTLGSAAAIRVGFHVGAGDAVASRRTVRAALTLSIAYAVCVSAALVLGRHVLATLYTNDATVLAIAVNLLLFVAVYQLADDIQATLAGSLRGYKDTRVPMLISLVGYWGIALPIGVVFGFGLLGLPDLGVYGLWLGMTFGLFVVAGSMALRARHIVGNERKIRALAAI
jgi:MATE family multidrug resistance protein